jgi:hypothetical protein
VSRAVPCNLSIVIAVVNGPRTARRCLAALAPQLPASDTEVLLVSAGDPDEALSREFPFVTWIVDPARRLVPEQWGIGAARATGRIIALTMTPCTPSPGWVDALLAAHRSDCAAVGGPIVSPPGASLVDRAVYLARYTPYMPPLPSGPAREVAGDNGSYKRSAIEAWLPEIGASGFWEATINHRLRAQGRTLCLAADALVTHAESTTFGAFCRQRFVHGRRFGAERRAMLSRQAARTRVLAAPIVPLVLLARIVRAVLRRPGQRRSFAASLPILACFLACWSAGECAGLARG